MLKEIKITNLALIEELHVSFDSNLIVFTGETGTGKSIILQAIDLLSGKRASAAWIREGEEHARVDAVFEIHQRPEILEALRDMGVDTDTDGELLLSRVLSKNGKNRYYLNGGLSTAKGAELISEYLLSVASQHDHQLLLLPRHHLDFIDLAGDLWGARDTFGIVFRQWQELKKKYDELRGTEKAKEQRRDYLSFQLREIRDAKIRHDEDIDLEIEKKRLKGSDELRRRGGQCYALLSDTAGEALSAARKELECMAVIDDGLQKLAGMVAEQSYVVEESIAELKNYLEEIPNDLEMLETVTARIDLLQKLKRKYGASLPEVLNYADGIEKELTDLESMAALIKETKERYDEVSSLLSQKAAELSVKRRQVGEELALAIKKELKSLCFDHAEFQVFFPECETEDFSQMSKLGWDRPEFLFSANPGEPPKPLVKIASGGELSRLTLAMKCILARKDMVETVIFDEVDAGIGGKAAEAVSEKIRELAAHHQVICISHLPQIASGAQEHFLVDKNVCNGRTKTIIGKLSGHERVAELARMLDGKTVSDQSLAFAAELIERNSGKISVHED
jgi:DNA repair protein RecN (Recombination protein N)